MRTIDSPSDLQETNDQLLQGWPRFVKHMPGLIRQELPGVQVTWTNADLPLYNALLFNNPIADEADLHQRLTAASGFMKSQPKSGCLFVCDDWLPENLRAEVPARAEAFGLHAMLPLMAWWRPNLRRRNAPRRRWRFAAFRTGKRGKPCPKSTASLTASRSSGD